jgi:hypothetical protein
VFAFDAAAGHLEEDIVERRRAQCEVAHRDLAVGEGDGDRADRRRPGVGGDDELVAVDLEEDVGVLRIERRL